MQKPWLENKYLEEYKERIDRLSSMTIKERNIEKGRIINDMKNNGFTDDFIIEKLGYSKKSKSVIYRYHRPRS